MAASTTRTSSIDKDSYLCNQTRSLQEVKSTTEKLGFEVGVGSSSTEPSGSEPKLQPCDSDSGRGHTLSGTSSSSSSDIEDTNQTGDCFVDASDVIDGEFEQATSQLESDLSKNLSISEKEQEQETDEVELSKNLSETAHILRLALSNEFIRALELCEPRCSQELYAGLAHATLSFLKAGLTLEHTDLQSALASVQNSLEVSARCRRQVSTASMLARFLSPYSKGPDYDSYTDSQIHAELVNAESMLLHTLISFLADQSVICLVKGAFRIRACHQRYKECLQILATRNSWATPDARRHFESGVRMGHGIFNLLMSYLPRRVLAFLEYVGFSGSRSTGIKELELSIELGDGLRSVLSALVILTYHSYVENLFGLGQYDESKVQYLNEKFLATFKDSAFFLLFQGRYNQMTGRFDEALSSFSRCIQAQSDWKQFHSICHWEMMWCHAVQMEWLEAAKYADLLRAHSKWSPASYTYQYASFLYAQLLQDQREGKFAINNNKEFEEKMEEIVELMASVPSLRIRYAGKTIPADKFAIERSMKFCRQNNRLAMPAMEFLYIWNIFCILKNSPKQVAKILAFVEQERERLIPDADDFKAKNNTNNHNHQQSSSSSTGEKFIPDQAESPERQTAEVLETPDLDDHRDEDLCLINLLSGMCHKYLGREKEAESSFRWIIGNQEKIMHKQEKFLVPHAAMELTLLKLHQKRYKEACELIRSTRSNYTGYLLETIVHFRLHAASRIIRLADESHQASSDAGEMFEDDGLALTPSSG